MESLTVNTFVKDIKKTIEFYEILGFKTVMTMPEGGDHVWAMMVNDGVTIMFQAMDSIGDQLPGLDTDRFGGALLFYIKTKNIRTFFGSIMDKVEVVKPLEVALYGATEFTIKDVDGFYLTFAEDE